MSKLFDNPTFDASQRISSPDVNQLTATNDSFTSEVPKKGWIENVTNRFQNLTLGKNIRNSGRSAQQDAETENIPKPASTSIRNLGMMPQVPPNVATDWKVYYVINLEPGRTVKIPKHPSWLPERLCTTEQFEKTLQICETGEQVFTAAFLHASEKGFVGLAALCKVLYATRRWGETLLPE